MSDETPEEKAGDPAVMARIMGDIENAETPEDILASGALSGKAVFGVPLVIQSYEEDEGENGTYFHINAIVKEDFDDFTAGEPLVINSGSVLVMAQLRKFKEFNALPTVAKFIKAGRAQKLARVD